jgi:uncharacterized Rmd1/YagE family protein
MAKKTNKNEEVTTQVFRIVSVAFHDNFVTSQLPSQWQAGEVQTESKDTRAKKTVGGGTVFAYKFGALTFVNVDASERKFEIDELRQQLGLGLSASTTTEEFTVEVQEYQAPRLQDSKLMLDNMTPSRLAVIAQVIAQSAAMDFYESLINKSKSEVTALIDTLAEKGCVSLSPKDLYKKLGYVMGIRNEVVGILHLLDRPDLIWDDTDMDRVYDGLRLTFDLNERFKALEYKMTTIQDSLELLAETVKDPRNYRAEQTIIVLIVIEVIFAILTRFHLLGW